MLPELWNK